MDGGHGGGESGLLNVFKQSCNFFEQVYLTSARNKILCIHDLICLFVIYPEWR